MAYLSVIFIKQNLSKLPLRLQKVCIKMKKLNWIVLATLLILHYPSTQGLRSDAGFCTCESNINTLLEQEVLSNLCGLGYKPVTWWTIFHQCHCRCCDQDLDLHIGKTESGDQFCGEWIDW